MSVGPSICRLACFFLAFSALPLLLKYLAYFTTAPAHPHATSVAVYLAKIVLSTYQQTTKQRKFPQRRSSELSIMIVEDATMEKDLTEVTI